MNEQITNEQVLSDVLTEDELGNVVGGSDGPSSPTDNTGAR